MEEDGVIFNAVFLYNGVWDDLGLIVYRIFSILTYLSICQITHFNDLSTLKPIIKRLNYL